MEIPFARLGNCLTRFLIWKHGAAMKNALYFSLSFLSRLARFFSGLGVVLLLVALPLEMFCFAQPGGRDRSPGGSGPGGGPAMQQGRGGFPGGGFPSMTGMSRRESSASTATPLVPEFGEAAAATPVVLKFGDYEQATAMPTVSSVNSQDAVLQQQINEQAQQLLNRYDRDKNGMIEKSTDEWKNLQVDVNTTDINRDGRITIDELRVYVGNQLRGGQAGTKIFTTFATTYEHLPEGIPFWFTDRDKDNDGQLSMFEYANGQPITEAMIGEFEWLDLNDDGIATLNECYSAIKTKEELESKRLAEESGNMQGRDDRSDDRSRDRRNGEGVSFTPGADQERSDSNSRERRGSEGRGNRGGSSQWQRSDGGRGGYGGPRN